MSATADPHNAVLAYSAKHLVGIEARADRSRQTAPCATSPTAEALRSDRIQSEFKSRVAYQICLRSPMKRPLPQKQVQCRFKSGRRYQAQGVQPRCKAGLGPKYKAPEWRRWRTGPLLGNREPPLIKFTLPAPDGKAPVLHTGMTRLDPGREYQNHGKKSKRRD